MNTARVLLSTALSVKRLYFGIPVGTTGFWIDEPAWNAVQGTVDVESVRGLRCWLSLDLSQKNDLTALTALWVGLDGHLFARTWYWTTKDGISDRARQDNAPYDRWAIDPDVNLEALNGATIDKEWVAAKVKELVSTYDVQFLAFDPAGMGDFISACERIGLRGWIGGHTNTLTTYGASIDGVRSEFGVAIVEDGNAIGGFRLIGFRKLDGTYQSEFGVDGNLVVSRTIYGDKLATNNIITGSAQIGDLVVDHISIKDGAISQAYGSYSGGTSASVTLTVRPGAKVAVAAFFDGAAGSYFPLNASSGNFRIQRDGNNLADVRGNFEQAGNGTSAGIAIQHTAAGAVDQPGGGTHTYTAFTTNNAGIGGVTILVWELSK